MSTTRSTWRWTQATARSCLRVGPLRHGGGQALIVDAAVPGVGNVIEQLADELSVSPEGDQEFLHVRLAYVNGG